MLSMVLALFLMQQNATDLDSVLGRAGEYVSQYEAELGNLIGTEEYVQSATWMDNGTPPRIARRMQRRTVSDFLIIQVGSEWTALRKVTRLDGNRVKEKIPSFEETFDDSPAMNSKRLEELTKESTEYNFGDVRRDINLPTFALKILRKTEVSRFAFEHDGSTKVGGVQTWRIRFRETRGPSLVSGVKGETLLSTGTLWIDPENGRVLQTELEVENPYAQFRIKGRITVTYAAGKKVSILVPSMMVERYESKYHTVECRADYSNFRPFEVDVKFEIHAPDIPSDR
jgi:hypothetical protein